MAEDSPYRVLKFTRAREMIAEAVDQSRYFNHIVGIFECDVTKGYKILNDYREKTGERLSITSWVIKCVAQSIAENPIVQTFRKGRRKMIQFEDADIKCLVEKNVDGKKVPVLYIIRNANRKTFKEINDEIRAAQTQEKDIDPKDEKLKKGHNRLMKIPKFIRKLVWRKIMKDPFFMRKNIGTYGVTAMGMYGKGVTGYAIPKTFHASTCAVGAIVKKPMYEGDKIVPKHILHLTLEFDHDIVDGAPAVRYATRLSELLREGYGLEDFE